MDNLPPLAAGKPCHLAGATGSEIAHPDIPYFYVSSNSFLYDDYKHAPDIVNEEYLGLFNPAWQNNNSKIKRYIFIYLSLQLPSLF
jgi:hypothetical protein